ncbi:hypothetical protein [Paenibacillus sp. J22TS3]|uniref:Acg family FMN-binding oxidoreductase n=1 Tax=Paenibacillus sp. J22TS3 TaxID=2807192 RepID=UPI001B270482|nr:hypothetical protein [Paenibacillus sp. J22TS3]GIP23598.1 hypothetical protein J22TS3_38730 [Paenibacillus sp. J22TS3]
MINKAVNNKMLMILIIILSVAAICMAVLFITSGIFAPSRYLEPWNKSYSKQFGDPRVKLVSHGILAANGHNMQPWKVVLDPKDHMVFRLYADAKRLTPEVDPFARQTMVSQGTFLEYIRIAGAELGYKTTIALFPEGEYDERDLKASMSAKPVAKITLAKAPPQENPLYPFMYLPDTNREPYEATPLSPGQADALQRARQEAGVALHIFQDSSNVERLGQYAVTGAAIEAGVHRINEESRRIFRGNEYEKNRYRYGFSLEGQGTTGFMKHMMQGLITIFPFLNNEQASSDMIIRSTQAAAGHTPAYAMILTEGNSRTQQVLAGMLYSRLILSAHSLGLVMQPVSQVLEEYPEMERQYYSIHRDYAARGGTIQMLVRVGAPTKSAAPTMRRDALDFLTQ